MPDVGVCVPGMARACAFDDFLLVYNYPLPRLFVTPLPGMAVNCKWELAYQGMPVSGPLPPASPTGHCAVHAPGHLCFVTVQVTETSWFHVTKRDELVRR